MSHSTSKRCLECETPIEGARSRVCCSDECRHARHKRQQLESWRARYRPALPKPVKVCEYCEQAYVPYRDAQKWCSDTCKTLGGNLRRKGRYGTGLRDCHKCGKPGLPRTTGKPVCPDCMVDPRANSKEKERRRRLRKYGLTDEQYAEMLDQQDGRCAICRTDDYGIKGPQIDHCHDTGQVRGLLCNRCNLGIGQLGDDPERMEAAARYVRADALKTI